MPWERLSISGASGMGKSTLAKALLIERRVTRRIILDPMDEYGDYAAISCEDIRDCHAELQTLAERDNRDEPFSIRFVPEEDEEHEGVSDADQDRNRSQLAGYLAKWSRSIENNVYLIDEAHDYCHGQYDPRIRKHLKKGRHVDAYAWVISQRPADVHPTLRAELNAHEAWYLRLSESVDLDVLRARRGKDFSARVQDLPPFHALLIAPGAGANDEPSEWVTGWDGGKYPFLRRISGSVPADTNQT